MGRHEKKDLLLRILQDINRNPHEKTLIVMKMKRQADLIALLLFDIGLPSTSIHGDRLQREQEEALDDFNCGSKPILVATAAVVRGLDIKDVMHVINYDMPDEVEEYVHRIGLTGQAGNTARATSFFDTSVDSGIAQPLANILLDAGQMVPDWLGSNGGGRARERLNSSSSSRSGSDNTEDNNDDASNDSVNDIIFRIWQIDFLNEVKNRK